MPDLDTFYDVTNLSMTGSEQEHVLGATCYDVVVRAKGGTVTLAMASGGAVITLLTGASHSLSRRQLGGRSIYLDGTAPAVAEIVEELGLSS